MYIFSESNIIFLTIFIVNSSLFQTVSSTQHKGFAGKFDHAVRKHCFVVLFTKPKSTEVQLAH